MESGKLIIGKFYCEYASGVVEKLEWKLIASATEIGS